jgi:hypothetical protein
VLLHVPRWLLVGVVLVVVAVVLIVQLLATVACLTLGALAVDVVGTTSLGEPVDLSSGETGEEFLGELVGDWLACGGAVSADDGGGKLDNAWSLTLLALVILESLEASEGSSAGEELMRELGLVVRLVSLAVVVTSFV